MATTTIKANAYACWATGSLIYPMMDTWLLFGKCDLGYGPEWGYVTLAELESLSVGFGLGIERDICVNSHLHDEWNTMEA